MEPRPIYMDNNSTTRVDPRVVEAMLAYFTEEYGNAASVNHSYGWRANDAVEMSRQHVGQLIGCDSKCVIFTSGATESNNIAIKGVMRAATAGSHVILNAAEHKAVIDPAKRLQREGFQVTVLPVDRFGMVDPHDVAKSLQANTALVSVMLANNEVGTLNPVKEIASVCRDAGVLLHTDATQAVGKIVVDVDDLQIDILSLSAHKMYGPKGIGALYVRRDGPRIRIEPLVDGGGHERHLRSGTVPVQQIVGLGEACRLCGQSMAEESARISELRDSLRDGLRNAIPNCSFNGHPNKRLPGNLHVSFHGVNSEALMTKLKDVLAVSSGSACTTADPEPSHVLLAMRIDEELIDSSIRFGLGRFNTADEVGSAVDAIAAAVAQLRRLSAT